MNRSSNGMEWVMLATVMIGGCGTGEPRRAEEAGVVDSLPRSGEVPSALVMPGLDPRKSHEAGERKGEDPGLSLEEGRVWRAKGILFTLPEGWELGAPSSAMRLAEIRASKQIVIPVFHFGGDAGGIQANIDRWKGQMTRTDASWIDTMRVDGLGVHLVVLEGRFQSNMTPQGPVAQAQVEEDATLLGAIVEGPDGAVFLKTVGSRKDVQAIRAGFEQMVRGVRSPRG